MTPLLAILIPTVNTRAEYLARLMECLKPQVDERVRILIEEDCGELSGGMPTGMKRTRLVQRGTQVGARFCAHVDDDDLLSDDYCPRVLSAIESSPDVCVVGMVGEMILAENPTIRKRFVHSFQYDHWFEKDSVLFRCPNHLNPVKTEIALQVPFINITFGEDKNYSDRLYPILKARQALHPERPIEAMLDGNPIYFYEFRRHKAELRDQRDPRNRLPRV